MSWSTCLVGSLAQINAAIEQINSNAGYPCEGTNTWGIARQIYEESDYFVEMPNPSAFYNDISGEELMNGVINVEQQPYNENWVAPVNGP